MLCKYIDMITQISVQIVYSEKRLENAYIVISDCELHGDVRITVKKLWKYNSYIYLIVV